MKVFALPRPEGRGKLLKIFRPVAKFFQKITDN